MGGHYCAGWRMCFAWRVGGRGTVGGRSASTLGAASTDNYVRLERCHGFDDATIRIDSESIPTVEAKSGTAIFRLLWASCMRAIASGSSMHRRIGRGELAEILGEGASRNRPLPAYAGRASRGARATGDGAAGRRARPAAGLCRGVNSYVREAMAVRPPEFNRPRRATGPGTRRYARLGHHDGVRPRRQLDNELLRLQMAAKMSVSGSTRLLPAQPGDKLPPHADYAAMYRQWGFLRPRSRWLSALNPQLPTQPPGSPPG